METLSEKPQSLLGKLGYKVLDIKNRPTDRINTYFGNVGFTYTCLSSYGEKLKIDVNFHTHEKTFTMSGKNMKFRRKGVVNNTVFPY